jgi:hypothetical protein
MRKELLCLFFVAACGSNKANVNASLSTNNDAGAADAAADAMPMMTDGGVAMADAAADAAPDAGMNPYAQLLPDGGLVAPTLPPEALDVAIDTAVNAQAAKLAPKMTLEGQPFRQTLAPGGRANMVVTLAPGKCYTIIGFSPPGNVTQFDLKLMTPPFYNVEAGHSDPKDKNMPVIAKGKDATCPLAPIAVPYRVDAIATGGGGRVGVYVFSRNK